MDSLGLQRMESNGRAPLKTQSLSRSAVLWVLGDRVHPSHAAFCRFPSHGIQPWLYRGWRGQNGTLPGQWRRRSYFFYR